jgi:hypothetical protein
MNYSVVVARMNDSVVVVVRMNHSPYYSFITYLKHSGRMIHSVVVARMKLSVVVVRMRMNHSVVVVLKCCCCIDAIDDEVASFMALLPVEVVRYDTMTGVFWSTTHVYMST